MKHSYLAHKIVLYIGTRRIFLTTLPVVLYRAELSGKYDWRGAILRRKSVAVNYWKMIRMFSPEKGWAEHV